MTTLKIEPFTAAAFAPYGQVLEIDEAKAGQPINEGKTIRFTDLSTATATGTNARVAFSMMRAVPYKLPHELKMLERHPFGSQSFMPVTKAKFLVVVAPDDNGKPGLPRAFLAGPGQGVNFPAGLWHGPLTALDEWTDFIVVDRIGEEPNTEKFHFDAPYTIQE